MIKANRILRDVLGPVTRHDLAHIKVAATHPKRAVDVFPALFKSAITDFSYFPATGEALAHLHCARERRMLVVEEDKSGVNWWRQA